jgi:hypothetical protein
MANGFSLQLKAPTVSVVGAAVDAYVLIQAIRLCVFSKFQSSSVGSGITII